MKLPSLSIVTQTYNEAPLIETVLRELIEVGEAAAETLEVVVVLYEGSTDGTNGIVNRLSRQDRRIRPIVQPKDQSGYGRAFRLGIYAATQEYVFQTDADGQFDFRDLLRAATHIPEYDYVHFDRGNRQDSIERKIVGRCFYYLIRLAVPSPALDFDSAFKLFRRDILDHFQLNCDSGVLVPEFVIKADLIGARIFAGSTRHRPRAGGAAAWEVRSRWLPFTLPNTRIVAQNLRDLRVLRREIEAFKESLEARSVLRGAYPAAAGKMGGLGDAESASGGRASAPGRTPKRTDPSLRSR